MNSEWCLCPISFYSHLFPTNVHHVLYSDMQMEALDCQLPWLQAAYKKTQQGVLTVDLGMACFQQVPERRVESSCKTALGQHTHKLCAKSFLNERNSQKVMMAVSLSNGSDPMNTRPFRPLTAWYIAHLFPSMATRKITFQLVPKVLAHSPKRLGGFFTLPPCLWKLASGERAVHAWRSPNQGINSLFL